jgi:hypothetical protein
MGFVLAGVGAATYLGEAGAIGWTGAIGARREPRSLQGAALPGVGAVITRAGSGDLERARRPGPDACRGPSR